jgi:hypothetical protein
MSIKMIIMPNSEKTFQQTSLLVSEALKMYEASTGVIASQEHQLSVNGRIVTESTMLNDGDYLLVTKNLKGNADEELATETEDVVKKVKQMLPKGMSIRDEEIFEKLPINLQFAAIATLNQGAAVRFMLTNEMPELSYTTILNALYHGKTISCGGKETVVKAEPEAIEAIFIELPAEVNRIPRKAIETAKELLAINCPMSTMIKITGLTEEQINSIS